MSVHGDQVFVYIILMIRLKFYSIYSYCKVAIRKNYCVSPHEIFVKSQMTQNKNNTVNIFSTPYHVFLSL